MAFELARDYVVDAVSFILCIVFCEVLGALLEILDQDRGQVLGLERGKLRIVCSLELPKVFVM